MSTEYSARMTNSRLISCRIPKPTRALAHSATYQWDSDRGEEQIDSLKYLSVGAAIPRTRSAFYDPPEIRIPRRGQIVRGDKRR